MRRIVLTLVWIGLAWSPTAFAWNDTGHMLAALVAWDHLSVPARESLAETLRAHPRFQEDFVALMPRRVRNAPPAEQDRWAFAMAATWPDRARRFEHVRSATEREALIERYHRPTWHYINLFLFLDENDRRALGNVDVNQRFEWKPTDDEHELNVVQALQRLTSRFHAPGLGDAERAVVLCWLLHLIGDIHQPLHTTALFTSRAFPTGDRGGNSLTLDGGTNLHALWDGALGSDRRWGSVLQRLGELQSLEVPDLVDITQGGSVPARFGRWAEEGHRLARAHVYVPEILAQVAALNTERRRSVPVHLPETYRDAAREVAAARLIVAGKRTAWVLEELVESLPMAADRCAACGSDVSRVGAAVP